MCEAPNRLIIQELGMIYYGFSGILPVPNQSAGITNEKSTPVYAIPGPYTPVL